MGFSFETIGTYSVIHSWVLVCVCYWASGLHCYLMVNIGECSNLVFQNLGDLQDLLGFRDVHVLEGSTGSITHHGDEVIPPIYESHKESMLMLLLVSKGKRPSIPKQ